MFSSQSSDSKADRIQRAAGGSVSPWTQGRLFTKTAAAHDAKQTASAWLQLQLCLCVDQGPALAHSEQRLIPEDQAAKEPGGKQGNEVRRCFLTL